MDPQRWRRLEALFESALPLRPAERSGFLDGQTRDDPGLAAEALRLLAAHEARNEYLDRLGTPVVPPARAGPYRVEEQIGQGGMGAVYLGSRADDQFEKRVAIKFLAPAFSAPELASRFLQERQILARLEHPNIARLLDAGLTESGSPFFVMEFIDGIRLDEWRRERPRTLTERLVLFQKLCDAVAYAHRALVVHRDIKPANILVTPQGEPKLVDFGIAKLLDSGHSLTAPSRLALTVAYASPEQLQGQPVSTSGDVYALGVVLYELLTATHPVPCDPANPVAFLHALAAHDPARPSSHLPLAGDLDAIALKALERDPARRYASADELARDIGRFLNHEPVSAKPATAAYQASKLIQRHKAAASFAMAALLSLTVGAGVALWQAGAARREARIASQINRFVQEMLGAASPDAKGRTVTVASVLDSAASRAATELVGAPEVQSDVLGTIGRSYLGLGLHEEAERNLTAALEIARRQYGPSSTQAARQLLARASARQGRGNLEGAEADSREAVAVFTRARESHNAASALNALGATLVIRGDLAAAERAHRDALALLAAGSHTESELGAETFNGLAVALGTLGRVTEAIPFHRQAYDIVRRIHPPRHPSIAQAASSLASALADNTNQYEEAARLWDEAISIRRDALGNHHPDLMWTLYNYAFFRADRKEYSRAETLVSEVLAQRGMALPDEHPMIAASLFLRGRMEVEQQRAARAIAPLAECIALRRRTLKPDHWLLATAQSMLGHAYAEAGYPTQAEPLLRESYRQLVSSLGAEHLRTRQALERLNHFRAR